MIKLQISNAEIIVDQESNTLNARNIAFAALKKQNEAVDSNKLRPVYLRKSNAEIQKNK